MLERSTLSRRQFLSFLLTAIPSASLAHGMAIEPEQLTVSSKSLAMSGPPVRFVHFTDLHFRGENSLTHRVAAEIRRLRPDFACFTGDLIESAEYGKGAFRFIRSLGCPVYGSPGNHDCWSGVPAGEFAEAFAATSGAWLENENLLVPGTDLEIAGISIDDNWAIPQPLSQNRILLTHYPQSVDTIKSARFSAILAGHSHGGQVRFPLVGAIYLPPGVGRYVLGTFDTPVGPLHVNAGIGTRFLPVRFCCPPELYLFQSDITG
jgi:uncharacterized protein